MKKLLALTLAALLLAAVLTGCASAPAEPPAADSQPTQTEQPAAEEPAAEQPAAEEEPVAEEPALADGVYTADFDTDSSMFHANEACDGKGTLTVKDGEMTIHVSLVSKTILNLFPGLAEDAQKDGAVLLQPTTDTVTYSDGLSEEVYGFDIPVPALDTEFDLALIGKKGVWYDHKVSVSNPEPLESAGKTAQDLGLADGSYTAEVAFSGGSGKSHIESPVTLTVKDGAVTATVVWSSSKYDYMLVDGERCDVLTTLRLPRSRLPDEKASFDASCRAAAVFRLRGAEAGISAAADRCRADRRIGTERRTAVGGAAL